MNATLRNVADLSGRVLIAALFLISGAGKLAAYAGTRSYMAAHGVPGALVVSGLWTRAPRRWRWPGSRSSRR